MRRLGISAGRVLREILGDRGLVAPEYLDALATGLLHEARLGPWPRPDLLARALGYEVWREPGAPCGGLTLLGRVLVVRASRDPRREHLAGLHELAHAEIRARGLDAGHGDVWLLTLALAAPREVLRTPVEDLRPRAWVPGWAVDLRVAVARRADREG